MDEKAKILIVEDERIIALETKYKLESMGYDVPAIASSGEDAIRKTQQLRPDLILMDIILQGEMDGVEAANQIHIRFDIPVVYVTANVSDSRLEDITRSEPFGCLFKPFEDMELQAAVKMALYKYQMDKKLRESEKRFKHLVKNSNDMIVIIDENGKETSVSDSVERITGFSPEEVLNHSGFEFLHPDDVDHISKTFLKMLKLPEKPVQDEYRHRRKDGGWVYLEAIGTNYLHEPSIKGIVINIRDITERRQAEEKLKESQKMFRLITENMKDLVFMIDLNGTIQYSAPSLKGILGYEPEEWLGRPSFEIIHPEDMEKVNAIFANSIATATSAKGEYRVKHADGHYVWVEALGDFMLDDDGQTVGVILNIRDITDRKHAEEEIRSHQEHLALINQILRHDITNDLLVIQSAINLYNKSPEEEFLEEISSHAEKSIKLIQRMGGLETFMSTHRELKMVELVVVIDEIIKNYDFIDFAIKGKSRVMADDSVRSVLDNIVRNAVIHGKADRITIDISEEKDMCEVRIADNGVGIPDDIKKRIFEEGFIHGDTGHTGIGLHVVQKAMEGYGGYAWAEDNKPRGAVFALRFRRVEY